MGILEDSADWLNGRRDECLSVPVVYQFKDGHESSLTATVGKTVFRAENEYGVVVRTETRDFLVSADKMPQTPQRGDKIIYAERIYEVLAPNGEPVWRWAGPARVTRRIHTKETGGIYG